MTFEKQRLIGHPMPHMELVSVPAAVQNRSSQITLTIRKTDNIIGGINGLHKTKTDGCLSISSHSVGTRMTSVNDF